MTRTLGAKNARPSASASSRRSSRATCSSSGGEPAPPPRVSRASTSGASPSGTPASVSLMAPPLAPCATGVLSLSMDGPACVLPWFEQAHHWRRRSAPVMALAVLQPVEGAHGGDEVGELAGRREARGAGSCPAGRDRAAPAGARSGPSLSTDIAERRLREAAQHPVHFLGAAVARAIDGAPAACFDVVGHEVRL